jgi:hypothetical protein
MSDVINRGSCPTKTLPGRPVEPFGYTQAEAKVLVKAGGSIGTIQQREPLGTRVRRFRNTGQTDRARSETLPITERLRRSAVRLGDGKRLARISREEYEASP